MSSNQLIVRAEFLAEDFRWCFVAEAFARRCVQMIADLGEIAVAERQRVDLSRKPFPGPSLAPPTRYVKAE